MRKKDDEQQLSLFAPAEEKIIKQEYSDIMRQSYIDYAMSVIVSRAVPDIRDGLKPVQRRILYDMGEELKLEYNKDYRKSARIVGDTMGKFHPHGDSSIYDAMVVMSQDFKKSLPLVDGHGNFGSIEGDGAAAQRYTEARLEKVAQMEFLADIDKDVVGFVPNYDETEKEPEVLPAKIPNFIVNGSEGIAVGMTTSTPPHNLAEVLKAEMMLMDKPGASIEDIMEIITGPDFPTGGVVANKSDLKDIYTTGTGKIRVRGRIEHEKTKAHNRLIITEIPYTMIGSGISGFLNDVAALVDSKVLSDIVDISNQSSKGGIKIVLDLKKNADDIENIKAVLFQKTKLEDTFGVNMLAIVDGRPETLSIKSALEKHIAFLFEIITKKYENLLEKEKGKAEIQEGLIKAVDILDDVIKIIRNSKTRAAAKSGLMDQFQFTDAQADAILDMRLSRLIGLELDSLKKDFERTKKNIEKYTKILTDEKVKKKVIKEDLERIANEYGRSRRTTVIDAKKVVIKKEEPQAFKVVVLMDKFGYIRAVSDSVYEKNKEAADSENKLVVEAMSDGRLAFFTHNGIMHTVQVNKIPFGKFRDKSIPVDNISTLDTTTDTILMVKSVSEENPDLLVATSSGGVKRFNDYNVKSKNTKYIKLKDGEEVVSISGVKNNIVLVSDDGRILRLMSDDIPTKKRTAGVVAGIALKDGEKLSGAFFAENDEVIVVNEKEIEVSKLAKGKRGQKGVLKRS